MDTITSLSNPLVKHARSLHQRKSRSETGLFLVEGIHHVGEVVEAGWEVESVLYAPELLTSSFARDLLSRLKIPPQPVSVPVMESLADKENPQGIVAVVRQRQFSLAEVKSRRAVALVSPQDPGNVGTILRTMDAVGADTLFLLNGGVELYHPTAVRASMGTLFWIPVIQTGFAEFAAWTHKGNHQLVGTSSKADADYQTFVPRDPWVLVMGNEQKGLSPDQTAACDVTISLPMQGRVSSLNLAVATGVFLYRYVLIA
jgi:RNA methyltransferase, TrmH family